MSDIRVKASWITKIDAEITRLRAENERLREALRPFADDAAKYWSDAEYTPDGSAVGVDVGDLRRARAALEGVTEPTK